MRKVFIDCGWYRGKAFRYFQKTKEYSDGFQIYAFEPFYECESKENFFFFKKAVWIFDGEIKLYSSPRRGGQANGIYPNLRAKKNEEHVVPCIDLSKFITSTFNQDDYIVLKIDIEGAEKEVLQKMIADNSIDLVDILYLENHVQLDGDKEFEAIVRELKTRMGDNYRSAIEW